VTQRAELQLAWLDKKNEKGLNGSFSAINYNMELSIFFAKVFAIYFVVFGFGMMFNAKTMGKVVDGMIKNSTAVFSIAIWALLLGAAMVVSHNIWEGWPVIITVIGWITLLKGAFWLLIPKVFTNFAKSMMKTGGALFASSFIVLIIGLVLGYLGFLA
jgi:hypothetical protein